ncbi:MAG: zinc dependent phospholipase C family protein [bacterium]
MFPKLRMVLFFTAWSIFCLFLLPEAAHAWGPGVHIETSTYVLSHLALVAPAIKKLLSCHPFEFIYGSVCPDMVLGKRFMKEDSNNHLWSEGQKILDHAKTDRQASFAFGYLSHLAADTIAHNHFVPDRLLDTLDRRGGSHLLHELIFDASLEDGVWDTARRVYSRRFHDCELLVEKNLPRTPFPRLMDRKVFLGGKLMVRMGLWSRMIRGVRRHYENRMDFAGLLSYQGRVHETVLDYLNNPDSAACLQESPTGGQVLARANDLRRTLHLLHRRALLSTDDHTELIGEFQRWRKELSFLPDTEDLHPIMTS